MKSVNPQEREKALNRIRKMFALANDEGASEGEVENALKFAQSLMAKYNIERDEVDLSPDDIDIEEQDNEYTHLERKYWTWDLLNVIGDSNDCKVIKSTRFKYNESKAGKERFHQTFYKIIGTREDRLLTKELFNLTVPLIRNLADQRFKERAKAIKENPLEAFLNPLPTKRFFTSSYIDGFIAGLNIKLSENKKKIKEDDLTGKYGLMIIKKDDLIENFVKTSMGKLKSAKSTSSTSIDGNAYGSGLKDGKENTQRRLM